MLMRNLIIFLIFFPVLCCGQDMNPVQQEMPDSLTGLNLPLGMPTSIPGVPQPSFSSSPSPVSILGLPNQGLTQQQRNEALIAQTMQQRPPVAESFPPPSKYIKSVPDPNLKIIRGLLEKPEAEIDLARVKLTIDKIIDPDIDVNAYLAQIDNMAKEIRTLFPANASSGVKLEILRTYLYEPNPFNNNASYKYNLDDPLGQNISTRFLSTYLSKKKGNCVSMPLLFVILGQKVGVDLTIAFAPNHMLVSYHDESGQYRNIEATSGGHFTREQWIQEQSPMTQASINNGLYLRPLAKKEIAAAMTDVLMNFYRTNGKYEQIIPLANLALEYAPKQDTIMLFESSAYYNIEKRDIISKYPNPQDIPQKDRPYFNELVGNYDFWLNRLKLMGWQPLGEEYEAQYLRVVEQAKKMQ